MNNKILFAIVFFTHNLLANENNLTTVVSIIEKSNYNAQLKIKGADLIITCQDCCYPVNKRYCNIFYILCKMESSKEKMFVFFKKNISDKQIIDIIKEHFSYDSSKGIFIVGNKIVYFNSFVYDDIYSEITRNFDVFEAKHTETNKDFFIDIMNYTETNYEKYTKFKRRKHNISLKKTNIKTIEDTLSRYNKTINIFDDGYIKVYNPKLLNYCQKKGNIKSTAFNLVPTNKKSLSNTINNNLFKKTNFSSNSTVYIVLGAVSGLLIITVVLGVLFYKKWMKKKNNKIEKSTKYKEKSDYIDDHVYEEPCFLSKNNELTKINNSIPNEKITEQNSVSNDIIISKNPANKNLTIIVVNTDKNDAEYSSQANKAIVINLPTDQRLDAKIIEQSYLPVVNEKTTIKDDTQQNSYDVSQHEYIDCLPSPTMMQKKINDVPAPQTNDTVIYDYNTLQRQDSSASKIRPAKPSREKKSIYVNIPITEIINTLNYSALKGEGSKAI